MEPYTSNAVGMGSTIVNWVGAMRELEDEIARLDLQSEQLSIHIQQLSPESAEAVAARANLDTIIHRLEFVKNARNRLLTELWQAA